MHANWKKISGWATAALVLSGSSMLISCQAIENRAGSSLISQFGNACITKGRWTEAAFQQNRALNDTLEELKSFDACKKFESQLVAIQGLSASLQRNFDDVKFREYLQHQATLSDLAPTIAQLPQNASDDAKAALMQGALEAELKLGGLKSDYNEKQGQLNAGLFKENVNGYIQNVQSMMSDLPSLQQCLMQSPRASMQMAVQLMAVAGNSSSPAMGAPLSVIGQLMSFALSFDGDTARIERAKYNNDKALMPQGLTCAMEAMTELYCQAEDVREQLEFQATSYKTDGNMVDPVWRGMDILTRRLPAIADMLRKIRNGTDPGDEFDAKRQNDVWGKVLLLDSMFREETGLLNKNERMYNAAGAEANAEKVRQTYIFSTLRDMSAHLAERGGPFRVLSDDERRYACMFALDPEGKNCPEIRPMDNLDNYIRNNFMNVATFEGMRRNWKSMYIRAREAVDLELAQQITIDPTIVMASTHELTVDNLSPYESLKMVTTFLSDLQKLDESDKGLDWNPRLQATIADTQQRINDVLDAIDLKKKDPNATATTEDVDRITIGLIYEKFQLRIGIQFIVERIKKFVEWDLNRRLRKGQFPGNTSAILAALGGEMTERMGSRTNNLDLIKLDLDRAQSLTQANLKNFLEYFRGNWRVDPMEDAANMLLDAAEQAKEPLTGARRPNRQLLAELCVLNLTSYAGDNSIDVASDMPMFGLSSPAESIDACRGALLESAYAERKDNPEKVAGLPLSLNYNHLQSFFSGQKEASDKLRHRLGLQTKNDTTAKQDPYAEIFHATVLGSGDTNERAFNRKVCTFHRFLRAGRVMESLPALNPDFRKALYGH